MGVSSTIDWWDEWKLRILVLSSLFVHSLLFFAQYVRQWYVLRWLRVIVWLAYIGGDALAIYALATLFNRQKQQQTTVGGGGNDTALEVVWAPVLLIHLGGRSVSAYSLEDNELWKRHVITVVSQVAVALYVFCKWWSGEKRLLQAAVLLFIVGFLRCGQKPWALRRASYGRMISTYLPSPPPSAEDDVQESSSRWRRLGEWCIAAVCTCTDFRDILVPAQLEQKPAEGGVGEYGMNYVRQLEEFVREAHEHVNGWRDKQAQGRAMLKDVYKMFLDLSAPYSIRLHYLQIFLNLDGEDQHNLLRQWIGTQFVAIYTKVRSSFTCLGFCTGYLVFPSLALASAVLFAKSDKDSYDKRDIKVTYILFFGTAVLELAPLFFSLLTIFFPGFNLLSQLRWQDMVAQHNIMSFCARKKKPPTLMKLATSYLLRDLINKHWYISHRREAQQISVLVRRHVDQPPQSLDERSMAQRVFCCMGQEGNEHMRGSAMISNAYKLAKALSDLNNDTEMWEVIQGVWVEMLCYSASRCRGYLHAKSLAHGGEFLTNVWVLWWCMGMQTLPDMMNNLGPPEDVWRVGLLV